MYAKTALYNICNKINVSICNIDTTNQYIYVQCHRSISKDYSANVGAMRLSTAIYFYVAQTKKAPSSLTGLNNSIYSNGGASRNRTEVHGFAIRCIATLPRRLTEFYCSHIMRDATPTGADGPTLGRSTRRKDFQSIKPIVPEATYRFLKANF